ncbi:LysR substrate-binding domain-containing protein [Zymobacter palmae]|uniref:Transcriptional regulator, LysR family n=1 Tax=Zymobacter palmae TaxID=33074 RepID=A0A348HI53_9GAMM|nr:LysR substrate-binding domain-containing protein [Zymobacter palmae]BBG31305.1 transcriptional regulator, LysR family [Zymobacter palmae]
MPGRPLSLDMDALRSFVAGIELGSFALAAERLCRSTSAVSAQLKKLEQQCGTALVEKDGRHLRLTESGEVLIGYAKRLLALNDDALEAVAGQRLAGHVRLGMQEDFGEALLPEVLGRFARAHPDVQISARIARNKALCHDIDNGQLDLALCWHDVHAMPDAPVLTTLPLQWIYHPDTPVQRYLDQKEPLPLVLFEAPCLMRQRALAALDDAGIPWRIVFTSRSLGGIWAAVNAGLGVTVRTMMGMPAVLAIDTAQVLPALPPLGISLLQSGARLSEETTRLKTLLGGVMQWQMVASPQG